MIFRLLLLPMSLPVIVNAIVILIEILIGMFEVRSQDVLPTALSSRLVSRGTILSIILISIELARPCFPQDPSISPVFLVYYVIFIRLSRLQTGGMEAIL
jgi:phosphatidylglycerophosphate synthase